MTVTRNLQTDIRKSIENMETVSVEWAPGHMAPYISKYSVEPVVLSIVQRYMTDFRNSISSNPDEDTISKDVVLKEIDKLLRETRND